MCSSDLGDLSTLSTPVFFYGPQQGEETSVEIESGKRLIIKLLTVGEAQEDGYRNVFFELNGQPRVIRVPKAGAATRMNTKEPPQMPASSTRRR